MNLLIIDLTRDISDSIMEFAKKTQPCNFFTYYVSQNIFIESFIMHISILSKIIRINF